MANKTLPRYISCDAHGRVHDVRREDCTIGEHCTSTGADCNAEWNAEDHPPRCCVCNAPVRLKGEQPFTLIHGCWDCPWGCPSCTGDTRTCDCFEHEKHIPEDPPRPHKAPEVNLETLLRWPIYINDNGRVTCNACDDWDTSAAGRRTNVEGMLDLFIEHIGIDHNGQLP